MTRTGNPREGAWVTELTGLLDLSGWLEGMRVIVRAERPNPGAQLWKVDPEWAQRNRLLRAAESLTADEAAKLHAAMRTADPTGGLG